VFLTQHEIVDILNENNFDISIRNLRYWRDIGELPKLVFSNGNFGYPDHLLTLIKNIATKHRKLKLEVYKVYVLEGIYFNIITIENMKSNGKYIHIMTLDNGEILIKIDSEENVR
jgi:hypothetical protein